MSDESAAPPPMPRGVNFVDTIHTDTYDYIKPSQFDLKGKAILITGASRGIGQALAISYAQAGASYIAIGARSSLDKTKSEILAAAAKAGRAEPRVLSLKLDVVDEDSVTAARETLVKEFGRLDILINNAGYLEKWAPVAETDVKEWWRTYTVNVFGLLLVSHAFIPLLIEGKKKADGLATVVNVSSFGAHMVHPGASSYQSSKLAVVRLTECFTADHAAEGLLAFSIHPGGVATELALGMPEEMHHILGDTPELSADSTVWLTAERREWLAGRFISIGWDMKEFLDTKEKVVEKDLLKVRLDVGV